MYVSYVSYTLCVSFAEYSLFYRALLQKRPVIVRSLLIVHTCMCHMYHTHYACICIYVCVCVCICLCICEAIEQVL